MLVHELRNIVNKASDQNERSLGRLFLVATPRNNRKLITVRGPTKTFLGLSEAFQLHRELAFSNFIIRETLQLVGQTKYLHSLDEPLGWVVLVPFDGVPVVHRELVVEIMITLSDGDKGSDHVIARCMLVIERSLAKPVSERIDTKGRVVNKDKSRSASEQVAALPVTPE